MQQVSQARGQLERGKPDAAIRTLEKAVRIDARNGEAFILLARAWKQKGERRKALEFAKKAELLCQKQPAKLKEVFLLESDLYRELGDTAESRAQSSRKASGAPQETIRVTQEPIRMADSDRDTTESQADQGLQDISARHSRCFLLPGVSDSFSVHRYTHPGDCPGLHFSIPCRFTSSGGSRDERTWRP